MKALKSHPRSERPRRINNRINLAKYTAGLVLALVGLISAAPMIVGGSADANHSFNGAELYDPKDERWSVISRHKSEGSDLRVAGFVYWRRMHK